MVAGMASCSGGGHSADDYAYHGEFLNGVAIAHVKDGNGELFINEKYEPLTQVFYSIDSFQNGYAIGHTESGIDSIYVITPDLKVKGYDGISSYKGDPGINSKGNLWVEKGDKWVLISLADGKNLCEPIDDFAVEQTLDNGNIVIIKKRDRSVAFDYAIYSEDGTAVVPFNQYTFIGDYSEGLARYSTNGYIGHDMNHENEKSKWLNDEYGRSRDYNATQGYIDENGNIVIADKYHYADDFKDGKAYVSSQNHAGGAFGVNGFFIDRQGNIVE